MKSTLGVLSLVLILVWSQAQDLTCNKTLSPEDLHQVEGDWVLVFFVHDKIKAPEEDPLPGFSSSHVELRVQSNHSLSFYERNVYGGVKCAEFIMNLTLHSERGLHTDRAVERKDGEEKQLNESATVEFLHASEKTMNALYHSKSYGTFLLSYRREGNHRDMEAQKDLEENRRLAQCLNLSGDNYEEWSYDGKADFCHRKSAAEEKDKEKEKEKEENEEKKNES